jgi:hypothetical protein
MATHTVCERFHDYFISSFQMLPQNRDIRGGKCPSTYLSLTSTNPEGPAWKKPSAMVKCFLHGAVTTSTMRAN